MISLVCFRSVELKPRFYSPVYGMSDLFFLRQKIHIS